MAKLDPDRRMALAVKHAWSVVNAANALIEIHRRRLGWSVVAVLRPDGTIDGAATAAEIERQQEAAVERFAAEDPESHRAFQQAIELLRAHAAGKS